MSANIKYTPAPQEDPEAHLNYTQPPPSYQAESSSAQDQERLFGGPRSSEDNIPDDFKVGPQHPAAELPPPRCH
jgi:hypothetical protein